MDGLSKAIKAAGSAAELSRRLGVSRQVVANWRTRGVPVERCIDIERATGGRVMRWDLCPEWRRRWPELARRKAAPKDEAISA